MIGNKTLMGGYTGARSGIAFENSNTIPDPSTLTYEGLFSENYFKLQSLTHKEKDLELSQAQVMNPITGQLEQYIGLLMKSKHDGVGIRQPIDLCVTIDCSGSMSRLMGSTLTRMELAKQACTKLMKLLGKDDHLALSSFTVQIKELFSLTQGDKFTQEHYDKVNALKASGDDDLYLALSHCYEVIRKSTSKKRRIILLTDLGVINYGQKLKDMADKCAAEDIYITAIGISYDCTTQLAELVSHSKGCNYFVAAKEEEIDKYLVHDFNYICFPSDFDVNIEFQSNNLNITKSIGTGFSVPKENLDQDKEWKMKYHRDNANSFNNKVNDFLLYFKRINRRMPLPVLASFCNFIRFNKKTICEINTAFPSNLHQHESGVFIEGSMILLRMKKETTVSDYSGDINLNFTTLDGQKHVQTYSVRCPNFNSNEDFFSDQNIRNALSLYYYAKWCRTFMKGEHGKTKKAMDKQLYKQQSLQLCKESSEKVKVFLNDNYQEYITKKKDDKLQKMYVLLHLEEENAMIKERNDAKQKEYNEKLAEKHQVKLEETNSKEKC